MTGAGAALDGRRPRSIPALVGLGIVALAVFASLIGLGTWQLQRRVWKLDLIARVERRVQAPPVAAPPPAAWSAISAHADAYRHIQVGGVFSHDRETLVQAVTDKGPGFWVMTPLRADGGFTVLVNRGFVDADHRAPAVRPQGEIPGHVVVTGLLRITEPGGGFLRANAPLADRWYSRDVAAIATARQLGPVAPYFVDADATANPGGWPVGGLTVITFPNSHLVYAITWFTLAAMLLVGCGFLIRDERRLRGRGGYRRGRQRQTGDPIAPRPVG